MQRCLGDGANEEDKNTSTELTKSVKVDLFTCLVTKPTSVERCGTILGQSH